MKRKPVISSDIKSVGYYEYALIMEVEFLKSGFYQYSRVPLTENVFITHCFKSLLLTTDESNKVGA